MPKINGGTAIIAFGHGELTACKPISDGDLAEYLAECVDGYDAAATPSTGTETLFDFYARLIKEEASLELRDHGIF
jgi:hypothetical protein